MYFYFHVCLLADGHKYMQLFQTGKPFRLFIDLESFPQQRLFSKRPRIYTQG
jgi:hypothetical protein